MELIVSGRGVTVTRGLQVHLDRRLAKLARLLPRLTDARVTCAAEKFRHTVHIRLRARRRSFSGVATAPTLLTAADLALEALERQVRDDKDRRRGLRGRHQRPRA